MIETLTQAKQWQTIFNSINFEFQRKDYQITNIDSNYVTLNSVNGLVIGDYIYISTLNGSNFATIEDVNATSNWIITDVVLIDQLTGGFVNCETYNGVNKYWNLEILINGYSVKAINSDATGLCQTDISKSLNFLFNIVNEDNYTVKYREDDNLGVVYSVSVKEISQNVESSETHIGDYNATLGCLDYSDLSDYLIETSHHGLFLTEFQELKYYNNQQFDIGILINTPGVSDIEVSEELHKFDGSIITNKYTLDSYTQKMVRIGLTGDYTGVKYIELYLNEGTTEITNRIKINVHNEICNSVNVHWVNALGRLDNWCFTNNQKINANTKATTFIFNKKEIDFKKTANEEVQVFLENEDKKYSSGLKHLLYALQIWIDNEPVRIKTGTFLIEETSSSKFALSCTFIKNHKNLGNL